MRNDAGMKGNGMVQLLVLFVCLFVGLVVAGVIASFVMEGDGNYEISGLYLVALAQDILAFCIPAWVTARYITHMPGKWLKLEAAPTFRGIIGVIIVYVLALPAMNWLIDWNQNLHLPESLQGLEDSLRAMEEANGNISEKMISGAGVLNLIASVLVIGIITGFSEELFFRGGMQQVMGNCVRSKAAAIWITAVIFSFLHFQFFGFVPRLVMGVFFGYLLVWTESLWVPIFAHALNNSVVALTYSPVTGGETLKNIENFGIMPEAGFPWLPIASVVGTGIFIWLFRELVFTPGKAPRSKYKVRKRFSR